MNTIKTRFSPIRECQNTDWLLIVSSISGLVFAMGLITIVLLTAKYKQTLAVAKLATNQTKTALQLYDQEHKLNNAIILDASCHQQLRTGDFIQIKLIGDNDHEQI